MRAVETGEMTRAAEYLDSNAKAPEKKKLAEQLGLVLNRAMKLEFPYFE
jgi:hypothetical protein